MRQFVLLFALLLVGGGSVLAQGEVIGKVEFERIQNNSAHPNLRWKGLNYRSIITTETSSSIGERFDYSSKWVTEHGSGGAVYTRHESRMGAEEPKRSETVRIGDVVFTRKGSGDWSQASAEKSEAPKPPTETTSQAISSEAEYRYLGLVRFRDSNAKLYQKTETRRTINSNTGVETTAVSNTKFWFGADGTLLRSEFRSNSHNGKITSRTGVVMDYELDPSIQISAPVLPTK